MKYKAGMFTVVPNLPKMSGIAPQAQTLFLWMCHFAGNTGECFPSVNTLAKHTGMTERTIQKWIPFLVEKNFLIVVEEYAKDGSQKSNRYFLEIEESLDDTPQQNLRGGDEKFAGGLENEEGVQNLRGHSKAIGKVHKIPPANFAGELKYRNIYNNNFSNEKLCAEAHNFPENSEEKIEENQGEIFLDDEVQEIFDADVLDLGAKKEKSSAKKEKIDNRNPEIQLMEDFLKASFGMQKSKWRDEPLWQRRHLKNLCRLKKKLGDAEFLRRLNVFLGDSFWFNSHRNSLFQVKKYLESCPEDSPLSVSSGSSFAFLPRK